MTATIRDLMLANLFDVFNERDRERRTTAIVRTYTDTVVFSDPNGITTGREALNERAQKLLEKAPDFVFTAAGPVYETHDLGYLALHKVTKEQPPVLSAMYIAIIRKDHIVALST